MLKDTYIFPVIIGKEDDETEYSAYFPDLDVATSGETEEDVLKSARELLGTVIFSLEEDKEKIPKPTKISDIKSAKNEWVMLIDVFMPSVRLQKNNKAVNRTVTIPAWLNALAVEKKINFSQLLQEVLKKELSAYIHIKF